MFQQQLTPVINPWLSALVALVPVATLLFLLAVLRITAWLAALVASVVTFLLAVFVWGAPFDLTGRAYAYGAATGLEAVDWITFWGVVIFNTLVVTGRFDRFRQWLVAQATEDVRVQVLLLAWAFGALLEGLVGFGYPWSVVAPILIALGVVELEALRVAAVANNAPVSFGALGAPIIALAAVTGIPLMDLSASVGRIVAILAILPPFVLIYLVSGWRGLKDGWPLAVVGAFSYVLGQFPLSQFEGPYLPDIIGSLVCFGGLLLLLRFWRPPTTLGYGGKPIEETVDARMQDARQLVAVGRRSGTGGVGGSPPAERSTHQRPGATRDREIGSQLTPGQVFQALLPFLILVVVVVIWTGPWLALDKWAPFKAQVQAASAIEPNTTVSVAFEFKPLIAGTAILASWLIMLPFVRPKPGDFREIFARTFQQMWGALLVGLFIFGLAYVFNFCGMAGTLADGFSKVGVFYIVLAPIVGWIGVALSGSNTSTNTLFGHFQATVGSLLGFPALLLPSLNSVGSEVGKPVAIQTASVGVSTTSYARREGEVIRHNMGWTLIILGYLIGIGCLYLFVLPSAMGK